MEILSANHGQTLQNPPIISLLEKRKDHVHEHHNVPLTLAARFSRGRWLNLAKRHRERADIPCNFKPAVFIHVRAAVHTRSPPELDLPSLRSKFTFQQIENRRATKSPPQCLNCREIVLTRVFGNVICKRRLKRTFNKMPRTSAQDRQTQILDTAENAVEEVEFAGATPRTRTRC